jgi:midasin
VINLLSAIITFWWSLFDLVADNTPTKPFDEALFQVYLSVGERKLTALSSEASHLSILITTLSKQFEGFHTQTKISSGASMEIIWRETHLPVIPTMKRLEDVWALERVAERFDAVVWSMRAPLEELSKLRHSISQAIDLARRREVDVESLVQVNGMPCNTCVVANVT